MPSMLQVAIQQCLRLPLPLQAVSGGFSQLLTGQDNSQLVLVPFKGQPEQHRPDAMAMHPSSATAMGSGAGPCDVRDSSQSAAGGGSAAPEPYQILMPVQMADGQMMALPADRAQVRSSWQACTWFYMSLLANTAVVA